MLKSKIQISELNSTAIQELDLLIEHCLRCESYFIKIGATEDANLIRDCTDITVLFLELLKRKSECEISYLNLCLDIWQQCSNMIYNYRNHPEIKNVIKCFEFSLYSFRKVNYPC